MSSPDKPLRKPSRTRALEKYECRAAISREEDGGFSAFALNLPGVFSQGETEEQAFDNLTEAFRGVLESYLDHGDVIPWGQVELDPETIIFKERRIVVNV